MLVQWDYHEFSVWLRMERIEMNYNLTENVANFFKFLWSVLKKSYTKADYQFILHQWITRYFPLGIQRAFCVSAKALSQLVRTILTKNCKITLFMYVLYLVS